MNRLRFENNLTRTKKKIKKEVNRLLSRRRGTSHTEILNSLNIADTLFHDEKKRQKILVILSDMIQDSKKYKFDRDRITNEYTKKVIRFHQNNDLVPKLSGVKVYVAGASAVDSKKFRSVQTFWMRYFRKSGADFSPPPVRSFPYPLRKESLVRFSRQTERLRNKAILPAADPPLSGKTSVIVLWLDFES